MLPQILIHRILLFIKKQLTLANGNVRVRKSAIVMSTKHIIQLFLTLLKTQFNRARMFVIVGKFIIAGIYTPMESNKKLAGPQILFYPAKLTVFFELQ